MRKTCWLFIIQILVCILSANAADFPEPIDVKKVDLSIDLFPETGKLSVLCRMDFLKNPSFEGKLYFEPLLESMKVTNSKGEDVLESFDPASGVLFLKPISDGNQTLFFEYSGFCRNEGIPSSRCYFTKDFLQFDDAGFWYPKSPVILDWHEAVLTVSAPEDYLTAGSGRLTKEVRKGGRVTRVFETEGPCARGMALFGGKYETFSSEAGDVKITIFIRKGFDFLRSGEWLEYVKKVVLAYSDRFGFFPCRELRIFQLPLFPEYVGRGGAQGCVMIGGDLPFSLAPLSHGRPHFVAHEILHQFFGAACFGNPLEQGLFLIEGTTEAISAFTVGNLASETVFLQAKRAWAKSVLQIPPDADVPMAVASLTSPHYSTFAYSKFPLFLTALRDRIGDEPMKKIECRFIRDYLHKGFPALNDFLGIIEEETGNDPEVRKLIRAWTEGPGLPGEPVATFPLLLAVQKGPGTGIRLPDTDRFESEIRIELEELADLYRRVSPGDPEGPGLIAPSNEPGNPLPGNH